jgi:hypothetical protein
MGTLFHNEDPHKHPTTVHSMSTAPYWDATLQAEVDIENGIMGSRFGAATSGIDVLTQQHNSYGGATWHATPSPGYWDGPAVGVQKAIWSDRTKNKPVINTENGYEWYEGLPLNHGNQLH